MKGKQPSFVNGAKRAPASPPVYRPQPIPKVLQQKVAPVQRPKPGQPVVPPVVPRLASPTTPVQAKRLVEQRKPPVAPPVYKPQPVPKVLQRKTIAPPSAANLVNAKRGLPASKPPVAPRANQVRPAAPIVQPKKTPQPLRPVKAGAPIRSATIQRKIDYSTSYLGQQARDREDLIEQLVEEFGEANRARLTADVDSIIKAGPWWSMKEIMVRFRKLAADGSIPVHEKVSFASSRHAPSPRPLQDFSFTQVTWLIGVVGDLKFGPIRNLTVEDQHAEERFMVQVENAHRLKQLDLTSNPRIVITINNSPCFAKCSTRLAAWVKHWGLTRVTIYFGHPYDGQREFGIAINRLQTAGIRVHGIDLSQERSDEALTARARKALVKLGGGLRSAKENEWYKSDDESSGSDADGESSSGEEDEDISIPTRGRARAASSASSASADSAASKRERSRSRDGEREKERAMRRSRRSARSKSPGKRSEGGGGGGRGRSRTPKPRGRPPRRAAAAAAAVMVGSGIITFSTWAEADYRLLRRGQRIRITNHVPDISDRIFELTEDYDPSRMEYPEVGRFVRWINQ